MYIPYGIEDKEKFDNKLKEVKVLDKLLIDELIEDIVIDENRNIKVIFKCEDKYFEALDFIKRQNYDIISSS